MRLVGLFHKLLDPLGPVGEIVSPSEVYKTRQGLPTHVARANIPPPPHLEHTLAAPRFVSMAEASDVPRDRTRQVSAYVSEHWAPVYEKTDSLDWATIVLASQKQIGWTVTQRESQQSRTARRAQQNAEQFVEICASAQIQANDDWANGYFETIPGNDPVVLDGQILRGEATYDENGKMTHDGIVRGGTMITKGRREYNAKTKGFVTWDKGTWQKHIEAEAEYCSRPVRNVRRALEAVKGEKHPMWTPVGINFKRDRRSAV